MMVVKHVVGGGTSAEMDINEVTDIGTKVWISYY